MAIDVLDHNELHTTGPNSAVRHLGTKAVRAWHGFVGRPVAPSLQPLSELGWKDEATIVHAVKAGELHSPEIPGVPTDEVQTPASDEETHPPIAS